MNPVFAFVCFAVAAPALKEPARDFEYRVVYATCVATRQVDTLLTESRFVVTAPGRPPDEASGLRFSIRYGDADRIVRGRLTSTPLLTRFEAGDSSYWVIRESRARPAALVADYDELRREVLPSPHFLIHRLAEKAAEPSAVPTFVFPGRAATEELAAVVVRGLRLKTAAERSAFAREEGATANKYVKEYLKWLVAREDK